MNGVLSQKKTFKVGTNTKFSLENEELNNIGIKPSLDSY
jgi:hypothetical protein